MPELPEVETTKRGIQPFVENQFVKELIVRTRTLRWPIPKGLNAKLAGYKIKSISRRAKYLLFDCDNGWLINHLGMSGSLRVIDYPNLEAGKHDHFDIVLANGKIVRYRDPRKFGCLLWTRENPNEHPLLKRLGPEPLSEEFNGNYLYQKLRNRNAPIKTQIMNNEIVTGVGNIYANESLYRAGIRPNRRSNKISQTRLQRLAVHIKETLREAITLGGSTLRDFHQTDGSKGYFQQSYKVYGRDGSECFACKSKIKNKTIGQRSSYYCVYCQR